nr:hypothetical protein GCM10020093_059010 [Planobispora longispora]
MNDSRNPMPASRTADPRNLPASGHAQIGVSVPNVTVRGPEVPRTIEALDPVFTVSGLSVFYGDYEAVRGVDMTIGNREITAMIGPSGCGKSTVLRCFNRMNDLIPGARAAARSSTTTRTCTATTSTPSRSAAGSAWSSRSPTPSPSRSTTTSPTAPGSTA